MQHAAQSRDESRSCIEFRLDEALRHALAIGAALVLCLPAARGFSETLGWLPLWLLAMPATALWALRGFPLPGKVGAGEAIATMPRSRRAGPQARRRVRGVTRRALSRAA